MQKMVDGSKKVFLDSTVILTLLFAAYAYQNRFAMLSAARMALYGFIYICCLAVLLVFVVLMFGKAHPLHKVFLFTGSAVVLISLMVNAPGTVPDEAAHISNTYLWSNRLLGISETLPDQREGDLYETHDSYIRRDDAEGIGRIVKPETTPLSYKYIADGFHLVMSDKGAELIPYQFFDLKVSPVSYFPAILGVTLGRLLQLGFVPTVYLGRLFMAAFYISGMYWAIRRIPFGKLSLFIVAILPMCIHLAPSFSYDSVLIPLSIICIAQIMYLAYGKVRQIGARDAALCGIIVFLLTPLKVVAYLPIVLLCWLTPGSRFRSRGRRIVFCVSMLLTAVVSVIAANFPVLLRYATDGAATNQYITSSQPAYTIQWVLQHPLSAMRIIANTTRANYEFYAKTMIGSQLGWLDIPVPPVIIGGLLLCMAASCFRERGGERCLIPGRHRVWMLIAALAVYVFFLTGMMVWWTPFGTGIISGIQGRYFIPILPLILIALSGFKPFEAPRGFHQMVSLCAVILTLSAFPNIVVKILQP